MDTDRAREILEVTSCADDEALEAAYREKVKAHHPDVTDDPDAAGKFRKVQEAKETLEQFRQRDRTSDRAGAGDSGRRRERQRPDWPDAGRGRTDRQSGTDQTRSRDSQWSDRSRSAPGQTDQWVNRETDERTGDAEWQYDSATSRHSASWTAEGVSGTGSRRGARRRERTRERTGRNRRRESEDQAATAADDAQQPNRSRGVRVGHAAGIGSMVYLAFLVALVGTASLLPVATTAAFVAGLGGLAWAGSRYPLSATGTTGLLGLSAVGVLPVGSGSIPGITSYSPLGIDIGLVLPITAAAAGIAYGATVRDGEGATDQSA